jgi:hypothetical protein
MYCWCYDRLCCLKSFGWETLWRDHTFYEMVGGHHIEMYVMKPCFGGVIVIECAVAGV